MAPASWGGRKLLERLGVAMVPNNQFLCGEDDFAAWSQTRKNMRMEDFYRWQRKRLDVLMDGTQPEGGRWNFDAENKPTAQRWKIVAGSTSVSAGPNRSRCLTATP